jgi:parallel beta helix pectate lyase-like protein
MLRGIGPRSFSSPGVCCIVLACVVLASRSDAAQQKLDQPTLVWMQAVLDNWEAVCRRDLRIPAQPLPWMIFYDEDLAWHLHPETRLLPPHEVSTHSPRFTGEAYPPRRPRSRSPRLAHCHDPGCAVPSEAQNRTTPEQIVSYSTIHSIGIEWGISGDANHNATVNVHYRAQGTRTWKAALPLVRVDNTYNGNGFAGSILFLDPDTTYKVRLELCDPDEEAKHRGHAQDCGGELAEGDQAEDVARGGADGRQMLTVATRPLPRLPNRGRRFHVVPGSGGGDGSSRKPFQGIAAAQAVARPGDIFFVHAGRYGGRPTFSVPGAAGKYIVWMGAGDGEALFVDGFNLGASHNWVEGLTVRDQAFATFSLDCPSDVVVRRNFFYNNHYNIYLQRGGDGWYIADNTIVGDEEPAEGSFDGEGIELNGSFAACGANNHTVAHNSITRVADGISTPGTNVDIFGNDIFDTSDDGIETDEGGTNVRVWGNCIHNAVHNAFSFQPQIGAPWYFIRNQVINNLEDIAKYRTWDRAVFLHNTFVHWTDGTTGGAHGQLMSSPATTSGSRSTAGRSGGSSGPSTGAPTSTTTASTGVNPPDPSFTTARPTPASRASAPAPARRQNVRTVANRLSGHASSNTLVTHATLKQQHAFDLLARVEPSHRSGRGAQRIDSRWPEVDLGANSQSQARLFI